MAAVLITALVVLQFTRRFASERAALFAAGCFVFCPLLLRKLTIAEPDTIITALVFGAFVIWWRGPTARIDAWRCLACGALLAIAAMAKGPQPIAYFALGIGGHLMMRKRWGEFAQLILTSDHTGGGRFRVGVRGLSTGRSPRLVGLHAPYSAHGDRHLSDRAGALWWSSPGRFAPGDFVRAIFLEAARGESDEEKRELWEMLFWYAGAATLVLFFWPGANTRYAMPAAPAVAVMAGLAFDDLWQRRRVFVQLAITILAALMVYQFALVCIVMPIFAARFGASRTAGAVIAQAVGQSEPVFNVEGPDSNQLFYVSRPIRLHPARSKPCEIKAPAWLVLAPAELEWLKARRPDYSFGQEVRTTSGQRVDRRSD